MLTNSFYSGVANTPYIQVIVIETHFNLTLHSMLDYSNHPDEASLAPAHEGASKIYQSRFHNTNGTVVISGK